LVAFSPSHFFHLSLLATWTIISNLGGWELWTSIGGRSALANQFVDLREDENAWANIFFGNSFLVSSEFCGPVANKVGNHVIITCKLERRQLICCEIGFLVVPIHLFQQSFIMMGAHLVGLWCFSVASFVGFN
jgi:hypothetical protein